MRSAAFTILMLFAAPGLTPSSGPAFAQAIFELNELPLRLSPPELVIETRTSVSSAERAVLRGLDKMSAKSIDLALEASQPISFGALEIVMHECRYPTENPNGDSFARLTIKDRDVETPIFDAWMVASSPALMALDHPRYDVWVIRCKLDNRTPSVVAGESSPRPIMRPEGFRDNSSG